MAMPTSTPMPMEERVICRRVTVRPPLVGAYLDTGDLRALREAVAEGDDGDDGVPPVDFKRFDAESMAASGSDTGGAAPALPAQAAAGASAGGC